MPNSTARYSKQGVHLNGSLSGTGGKGNKCSWCLEEQGIAPQNESHGICERHMELLLAEARHESTSQRNPSAPGRYAGGKEGE